MLEQNGVLDLLEEKERPQNNKYKSDAHIGYDYSLYVKYYSTYKTSSQRGDYKVIDFVSFVDSVS